MGSGEIREIREMKRNNQCPMPNAQCPMPMPNAPCPCPIPNPHFPRISQLTLK
ncbi:hypothetical protein [Nostoc sp. CHAB 5715]|uniref:hypothetical protein n=1 Tax=Nostoc sp. CHAB 5715 TaxID=2780400 RepID=UPI001E5F8687|nr:hypothetical protein [Nostoc sp. CHAB 5715]MCC5621153.1 hypothetical protein [Nostoc sp. CHAB 5715]